MSNSFDEKYLYTLLSKSADEIDAKSIKKNYKNSKLYYTLTFDPSGDMMQNEDVKIYVDIRQSRLYGSDIPHWRLTTYFPYTIKDSQEEFEFLIALLFNITKATPFVELGVHFPEVSLPMKYSFRCNHIIQNPEPTEAESVELISYLGWLLVIREFAILSYEKTLARSDYPDFIITSNDITGHGS